MTRPDAAWAAAPERGSDFWVRLGFGLAFRLGWRCGRVLLWPITAWFVATSPAARQVSRDYLGRVLGRPARLADVVRHFHAFAATILDAPFLLAGRSACYAIEVEGLAVLEAVLAEGRGCILLGGHIGSYEVLRHFGQGSPVPVRPMMFRRNAGAFTALLDRLDPALGRSVIAIGTPESLLTAREALQRGEIVGILGDRNPTGGATLAVPFLGSAAAFPLGPLQLVAALGAPVVLFRAVAIGPRRYRLQFEPLPMPVRRARGAALHDLVARYAAFLEAGCRAHPYQWFNFFSLWNDQPDADVAADPPSAVGAAASRRRRGAATRARHPA